MAVILVWLCDLCLERRLLIAHGVAPEVGRLRKLADATDLS